MSDYTSEVNAILDESYTTVEDVTYHTEIADEHDSMTINKTTREITTMSGETIVAGDANSVIKTFTVDRYYDGVDLSTKTIKIVYRRADGEGDVVNATDVMVGESQIVFCWLLNNHALYVGGELQFIVEFIGTGELGSDYVWKTRTCTLNLNSDTLSDEEAISPAQSWVVEVENRITFLEENGTGGTGTGTTNYERLTNLPYINSVQVKGSLSLEDIGASAADHNHDGVYVTSTELDTSVATAVDEYVSDNQDTLKGSDGRSAYEIAVAGGYTGTETQWLASLKGDDGASSDVSVNKIGTTTTITTTGADGTVKTATVEDGKDGDPGVPGNDGVSVTHEWDGTTLRVTSASGTTSADLKGDPGNDMVHEFTTITADSGSSILTTTILPNVLTELRGNVDSDTSLSEIALNIVEPGVPGYYEYNVIFTTSASGCNLTVPDWVLWDGGTAPTLEVDTLYEMSILWNSKVALISNGVSVV